MNLCYVYNDTINYKYIKPLLKAFDETEIVDISVANNVKESAIYVIEPGVLDKNITTKLRDIFKSKKSSLIYFISDGVTGASFYQLAFILKVKSILTSKQDIKKVIQLIKNNHKAMVHENKSIYVGKFFVESQCYMIFKEKELYYASDALLELFRCYDLSDVRVKVCSKLNLKKLLEHEDIYVESKQIFEKNKLDIVKSIYRNGEYLVSLDRYDYKQLNCNPTNELSTRLKFIEFLKERLIEESDNYSIITIKISNFKKINNIISKAEFESFIQKFAENIKLSLQKYLVLSEYKQDFFIAIYKNIPYKEVIDEANYFFNEIQEFINKFSFKPTLILHVAELKNIELGNALLLIDDIRNNKLSKKDVVLRNIKFIGQYNDTMSKKDVIDMFLESAFINESGLVLTNYYKGLLIDSPTKIIRKDQSCIFVTIKQIQGAAMSIEKETILKSFMFEKDIKARVSFIDSKKKIAKLEDFRLVEIDEDEAIAIQDNCRVDFAKKTSAVLILPGTKITADIIDISVKSISLKVSKVRILERLIDSEINIEFSLPVKSKREGYVKINEKVVVAYLNCQKDNICKMICEFPVTTKNKTYLIEYVHNRQVEILDELKLIKY